jgi:hypothetical protein
MCFFPTPIDQLGEAVVITIKGQSGEAVVRTLMINLGGGGYKMKDRVDAHIWKLRWRKLNLRWSLTLVGLKE